mgnify:CR=1 FL=1
MIVTDQWKMVPEDTKDLHAYGNYMRRREIASFNNNRMKDYFEFKQAFPEVQFRYFMRPSEPMKGGLNLLNFNNDTNTYAFQMIGRKDGANAVAMGQDFLENKFEEWTNNAQLRVEFKNK